MNNTEIFSGRSLVGRATNENLCGNRDHPFGVTNLRKCFGDRVGWPKNDDLWCHETTSSALFIRQQAPHHGGVFVVHCIENSRALFARHFGEQVG